MKNVTWLREHIKEISIFLGVIALVGTAIFSFAAYLFKPKSDLSLEINATHNYFPKQFSHRLSKQKNVFSDRYINVDVDEFLRSTQFASDDSVAELLKTYLEKMSEELYAKPFEKLPSFFDSVVHIKITNNGNKATHGIEIKLPAIGLIERVPGNHYKPPESEPMSSELTVSKITGNNHIDIWVYFDDHLDFLDMSKLTISHNDVLVDYSLHQHFDGIDKIFANNWFSILMGLFLLLIGLIYTALSKGWATIA